jgi:hypothetical protein
MISEAKKNAVRNLYLSNIGEEFIAMQVDLEIPVVISILKELGIYRSEKKKKLDLMQTEILNILILKYISSQFVYI